MKQDHIDKIKQLVNQDGLINTLNLLGGNKDIIRKVYTDNPESYLDYLIGNLMVSQSNTYNRTTWTNSGLLDGKSLSEIVSSPKEYIS